MTESDLPPEDGPGPKYTVHIENGEGTIIGDNPQVIQNFYDLKEAPLDLDALEAAYRQKVVAAYNELRFTGLPEVSVELNKATLKDIFVRLALTVEKEQDGLIPLKQSGGVRQHVVKIQEPIELGQALQAHILVSGEPGGGKSTLLHWLAVTFADSQQRLADRIGPLADENRIPILVELGQVPAEYLGGDKPLNWLKLLPEWVCEQQDFYGIRHELLEQALDVGRCLVLFDGLDEVIDYRARVKLVRSLADLARNAGGNRLVVSSRLGGLSDNTNTLNPQFQHCRIERFKPEDVRQFFRLYYALDSSLSPTQQEDAAETLYQKVAAVPSVLKLATTPLLATLLLLIWRNEGELPERRVELYERCCRVLAETWEKAYIVAEQGIVSQLSWINHLHLLEPVAYTILEKEQGMSISRSKALPILAQAVRDEKLCTDTEKATREAEQYLNTLALRSGLLQYLGNERGEPLYGFPHLTFQEYLAARYIARQPDPTYIELVLAHLHENRWREVHLLAIAHLGSNFETSEKASTLLLAILNIYPVPASSLVTLREYWPLRAPVGRFLPWLQWQPRVAWLLSREFELLATAYLECRTNGITEHAQKVLSSHATSLLYRLINDPVYLDGQENLLNLALNLSGSQYRDEVKNTLLQYMGSQDENVAPIAAHALKHLGYGSIVVDIALQQVLSNPNWLARMGAAIIIHELAQGNEHVIAVLRQALQVPHWSVLYPVAMALALVGKGNELAVTSLLQMLNDPDATLRLTAVAGLGRAGQRSNEVLASLLRMLHDPEDLIRRIAAASLVELGQGSDVVIAALLQARTDPDRNVREAAIQGLGKIDPANDVVVSTLVNALQDPEIVIRLAAAEGISRMGKENSEVRNILLNALHDSDPEVRVRAAESLGRPGQGSDITVNALLDGLRDSNDSVRKASAESLGKLGQTSDVVVRALLAALNDSAWPVRGAAAEGLGQLGQASEEVVKALLVALNDSDRYVRQASAESLGQLKFEDDIQLSRILIALNLTIFDRDHKVSHAALESMRTLLNDRQIPGYRIVPVRAWRTRLRRWRPY